MARINPFSYKRPERPVFTREFTDPLVPGEAFTLRLRSLDAPEAAVGVERAQELTKLHVTGDKDAGVPPVDMPLGELTTVPSEVLFHSVCSLELMQVPPEGEQPYSAYELIGLSITWPNAWSSVLKFIREVNEKSRGSAKNDSGAQPEA